MKLEKREVKKREKKRKQGKGEEEEREWKREGKKGREGKRKKGLYLIFLKGVTLVILFGPNMTSVLELQPGLINALKQCLL
jgi:hypothetical protein